MYKIFYPLLIVGIVLTGCRSSAPKKTEQTVKSFKTIEVPLSIASAEERGRYVAKHYWDNFDFSDTTYISLPDVTEQAFADYANIMMHLPENVATESIKNLLDSAMTSDRAMFDYLFGLCEKYFHDPNSPLLNEDLYVPALTYLLASDRVDSLDKVRPRYEYKMAMKNRKGEPASDFAFRTISGGEKKLYSVKSPYTVLLFYNLGCSACKAVKDHIKGSEILNDDGVKIVAIYPDKEMDEWQKQSGDIPATWINGCDKSRELKDKELYDLKAIPTVYLLDANKTVLLRDAKIEAVEAFLAEKNQASDGAALN